MKVLAVFAIVSFCHFVLLKQADAAVGGGATVEDLAGRVYKDISVHKHGSDDVNKIAYLYIHYEDELEKPDYKNEVVKKLFDSKGKMKRKLKQSDTPYFPGPPELQDLDPGDCHNSNLMIGTIPGVDGLPKLKKILDPLSRIDGPAKCPKLVIFGRSKYADKKIDLDGWPMGDDGLFNWKKIVGKYCGNTEFFYYVHQKPKAETVLALFANNHVNIDFQSNHP